MARKEVGTKAEMKKGVLLRINDPFNRSVLEAMQKITKKYRERGGKPIWNMAFIHWDKERGRLEATNGQVILAWDVSDTDLPELLGDDRYWEYSKQGGCVLMKADWPDVDYLDTQKVLDESKSLYFKEMKISRRVCPPPYRHVWLLRKAEREFHKCISPALTAVAESIADEFDMIASDAENPSSAVTFKNDLLGLTFIAIPTVIDEERK